MKLVVYTSSNTDQEVIVMPKKDEAKLLTIYFTNSGRELEDYDREVYDEGVSIWPNVSLRVDG